MPSLHKQFNLEITIDQFLNACSLLELQELDMRLDSYLKKAEHEARRKAYREASIKEEFRGGFMNQLPKIEEIGFDEEF